MALGSTQGSTTGSAAGSLSETSARLLRDTDRIRFVPDGRNGTVASFSYRAWDQTSAGAGQMADTTVHGGDSAFSDAVDTARLVVSDVNDAPVLAPGDLELPAIDSRQPAGAGHSVADLLAGRISDVDHGAAQGLAIIGTASDSGSHAARWQYSIDGGQTWQDVGPVSDTQALLLRSQDRLRLVPPFASSDTASLQLRAWDQSQGSAGERVDASHNGSSSAFSATAIAIHQPVQASTIPTVVEPEQPANPEPPPGTIPVTPTGPLIRPALPTGPIAGGDAVRPPGRDSGGAGGGLPAGWLDSTRTGNAAAGADVGRPADVAHSVASALSSRLWLRQDAPIIDLYTNWLTELGNVELAALLRVEPLTSQSSPLVVDDDVLTAALPEMADVGHSDGAFDVDLRVAAGVAFSFSVALWLVRGGALLTSLLLASPAWRHYDLLPVVRNSKDEDDNGDEDDRDDADEVGGETGHETQGHTGRSDDGTDPASDAAVERLVRLGQYSDRPDPLDPETGDFDPDSPLGADTGSDGSAGTLDLQDIR